MPMKKPHRAGSAAGFHSKVIRAENFEKEPTPTTIENQPARAVVLLARRYRLPLSTASTVAELAGIGGAP